MRKVIKYVVIDILRNKIMIGYTLLLLLISLSVFNMDENVDKGLLSMLNIILIIVPLISIVFSTIYYYNSAEFIELLVSQPLKRTHIILSIYTGLAFSLMIAFFIGCGMPILLYNPSSTGIIMLLNGLAVTAAFVSIALLAGVMVRDKAKGIGVAILLWFYFSLIYDGLVLFILFQFADYPMENPMIVLSSLNPIDLSRIMILLKMDVSALMGYTGAIFRDFLGNPAGMAYSVFVLLLWIVIPAWLAVRKFRRKDI